MAPPAGYNLVFESEFGVPGYVPVSDNINLLPTYVFGQTGVPQFFGRTPYFGDFGDAYFTPPNNDAGVPSPFAQRSGQLVINPYIDTNGHWRTGMLSTIDHIGGGFTQALGYWECSFTVPAGNGTWPSFWLNDLMTIPFLGHQNDGNHYEIDICELYGHNGVETNQHFTWWAPFNAGRVGGGDNTYNAPSGWTGTTTATAEGGHHVYGCLITTAAVTFYMDSVQIFQSPSPPDIASHQFYGLLTYALGAGYPIDITSNAAWMWVQYVRAYSLGGPSTILPSAVATLSSRSAVGPNQSYIGHPFPDGRAISVSSVTTHQVFIGHPFPNGTATSKASIVPRYVFPLKPPSIANLICRTTVIPRRSLIGYPSAIGVTSSAGSVVPGTIDTGSALSDLPPPRKALPRTGSELVYLTEQGDMFDAISYKLYRSERFSPVLMRVNSTYCGVVRFDAGVVLIVPAVQSQQNISNVPWGSLILN